MTRPSPGILVGLLLLVGWGCTPGVEPASAPSPVEGAEESLVRDVYPFQVFDEYGEPYDHPFLGGFVVPRPQFVDLDEDGDPDLFIQERSGELIHFENVGSPGAPDFVWRTDRFGELEVGEWSVFVDLDHNGRYDLLTELPYSYMRVYRNEGTPAEPDFVVAQDSLRNAEGRPIFADRQNIPHLTDLDCSGNWDLFLGRIDGMITHLREVPGSAGGAEPYPRFEHVTERFENIEIIGQIGATRHGANAMSFIDMTGDGTLDLLWGDYFEPSVLMIENTGGCPNYNLDNPPEPLFTPEGNIATSGHNVPVPASLVGDGRMDLIVGVLGGAFNPNLTASTNLHHYRRGDDDLFRKESERFLYTIDVGSESIIDLGDVTGNGLPDLVVGNKIDPVHNRTGRLYLFLNEGSEGDPRFQLADTLSLDEIYHYAPTLGELYGDGRNHLALGTWNDGVQFYRNTAPEGEVHFERDESLQVTLTRGSHTVPALADLTGNGLLDLVVGKSNGALSFFRNVGTAEAPDFELVTDDYFDIDAGRRSAPYLADITGNGLPDLLVGREDAGVLLFRNEGTAEAPDFVLDGDFELHTHPHARAVPIDLSGDGRVEILSGSASGGVIYFRSPDP